VNSHLITQIGQTHLSSKQNVKNLKDGSQVLVRVIAYKGNGKYEGSVGGVRTYFQANNPLKTGASFVANVTVKNGQIQIQPKTSMASVNTQVNEILVLANENQSENIFAQIENQKLAQFVAQFNVPSDNFSLHLLLQMKQLGMKFDGNLLAKIRNAAVRFSGNEKKTGELLLMLAQKGINPSEDELEQLILELEKDLRFTQKGGLKTGENNKNQNDKTPLDLVKDFISSIFAGMNQNKVGLLTVLNQTAFSKNTGTYSSWVILPFELIESVNETYDLIGSGNMKLLVNGEKSVQMIHISCNYKNDETVFVLEFDRNKLVRVKFNVNHENERIDLIEKHKNRFVSIGENVDVEWCDFSKLEGTACENEQLVLFSGEV